MLKLALVIPVTLVTLVTLFVLWIFPWVFSFHMGTLVYFPYSSDGNSRYLRMTGPLPAVFGAEWASGENIPKACRTALIASEDTKFNIHHGVDFESLQQSIEFNKKSKKKKRGGSTITQQLVKNAFLSRDRTWLRKGREILGALILDAILSKENQLNWYFNVVEFGPNIYGIKKAASHYFKKKTSELSAADCISLVAILPSPNKWNKSLETKAPSGFFKSRYNVILARMQMMGLTPVAQLAAARKFGTPPRVTLEPTADADLFRLDDFPPSTVQEVEALEDGRAVEEDKAVEEVKAVEDSSGVENEALLPPPLEKKPEESGVEGLNQQNSE